MVSRLACSTLTFALAACNTPVSPSPQPLPPPIGIDSQAFSVDDPGDGTLLISGAEGALTSATTLELGFWDGPGVAPVLADVPVNEDGSFSLQVAANATDLFRFQAFNAEEQTEILDLVPNGGGGFDDAFAIDCVVATPAQELVLDPAEMDVERGEIVIDNQCTFVISIDEPLELAEAPAWEADPATVMLPSDILPGTSITFNVLRNTAAGQRNLVGMEILGEGMDIETRLFTIRANR